MASGGNRGSAGERVLESRHVIGLFMAVIELSGLFFTLGYVMGRNQVAPPVMADLRESVKLPAVSKPDAISKKSGSKPASADSPSDPSAGTTAPGNSEWEFYHAGDRKKPEDRLKPVSSSPNPSSALAKKNDSVAIKAKAAPARAANSPVKSSAQQNQGGSYTLQVAALTKDSDALDLAKRLQQKRFPAYVLAPKADKYYRVQVGPYSDPKAAEAARKGLEGAGFKAFLKPNLWRQPDSPPFSNAPDGKRRTACANSSAQRQARCFRYLSPDFISASIRGFVWVCCCSR